RPARLSAAGCSCPPRGLPPGRRVIVPGMGWSVAVRRHSIATPLATLLGFLRMPAACRISPAPPSSEVHVSGPSHVKDIPIEAGAAGRAQLLDFLVSGARPRDDWKIGTEHEKFGFQTDDLRPPTF